MNGLKIEVIDACSRPQRLAYAALRQCYSEGNVFDELARVTLSEKRCGEIVVDRLLKGDKGHYGCLERGEITFNVIGFPHSAMQQARTHRISVSFDVQSGRYTGKRIYELGERLQKNLSLSDIEKIFYLRPVGIHGYKSNEDRDKDLMWCGEMAREYRKRVDAGYQYEVVREVFTPYCVRQDFVVTFNIRSLMHFLDLRAKKDAQQEIQIMADMTMKHFRGWAPEIANWYESSRLGKARLAP